jgi:hypothetical protein
VLEYRTKYSQLPTTGALVGDTFYFITNSQIDHYKNGKLLNPEGLVPIVVAKVDLVHQVRGWYSGVAIKMGRRQGATREHI